MGVAFSKSLLNMALAIRWHGYDMPGRNHGIDAISFEYCQSVDR